MKYYPHREEVTKFLKGTSQPAMLTDPFPTQQQQMVAQNHAPLQGGNSSHFHHGDAYSSITQVFMCKETIIIMTRAKTYDIPPEKHVVGGVIDNPSTSTPPPSFAPLKIDRHVANLVLFPPKEKI